LYGGNHQAGSVTALSPDELSETGSMEGDVYCFGHFRLIVRERMLMRNDVQVTLGSRAFDVLVALVERAGETLNRQELFQLVWPDVVVAKVNLRVHVATLRKVLGDGHDGNRFIISVAGRGYRFVAAVNRVRSMSRATSSTRVPMVQGLRQPERMLGREAAISTISSRLARKRFISLGGAGAWGRALVAFAVAHTLAADADDTVCFVDFVGIDDAGKVAMTVASALGCEIAQQPPLACVLSHLRDKETLLVFDNCDHVFAGVVQLTELLFSEAPLVRVLVSSREALRLSPVTPDALRPEAAERDAMLRSHRD
jgi:DNA-binding winged helix-turn-helix (wHTH) protein